METHAFSQKVGRFVLRFRWPIILVNLAVLAVIMAGMVNRGKTFGEHVDYMKRIQKNPLERDPNHVAPKPIFNADYHVFFQADNPDLVAFDDFQDVFAKEDNLVIVLIAKNGDIFTNENLKSLKELTDLGWTVPYVNRVDGITNFSVTSVDEDDLLVEDFIDELPLDPAALAAKKAYALSDHIMPHFLISKDARVTQISFRVVAPLEFADAYLQARNKTVEIVEKIKAENPNLEVRLGGTVMLNNAFFDYAMADQKKLTPLMLFVLIPLALLILLRSFWGTVLPMLLLLTSVMFPILLFVGNFNYSLTNVSMTTVQMLVAIAVADSVHILAVFFKALR